MQLTEKEKSRLHEKYGPWALVTGASSGIGKSVAENLASAGFHLTLVARRKADLEIQAEYYRNKFGVECFVHKEDLSDINAPARVAKATANLRVGLVVLSAGFGTSGEFHRGDLQSEIEMLRVNGETVMRLCHYFGGQFAYQKRGGIILLSSLVAFQGVPYAAHYAATKAYVQSLGEALAVELKSHGVDVLVAAPGPVASGFGQRAQMQMGNPPDAARIGAPILRKLGRGYLVMPGALSKLLIFSLKTVPRRFGVRIMQIIMGSMTKDKRSQYA